MSGSNNFGDNFDDDFDDDFDDNFGDNFDEKVISRIELHLWTFKTPTSWAVMSDKDDADWALSVPNGVKREWKWILLAETS